MLAHHGDIFSKDGRLKHFQSHQSSGLKNFYIPFSKNRLTHRGPPTPSFGERSEVADDGSSLHARRMT